MALIEATIADGPLVGEAGYTVEEPVAGKPWPDVVWTDRETGESYVYRFHTMSLERGGQSSPAYKLVPPESRDD